MAQDDAARRAIDAANRRFEAAFNAGDFAGAAREVYTADARVLPPDAPWYAVWTPSPVSGRRPLRSWAPGGCS